MASQQDFVDLILRLRAKQHPDTLYLGMLRQLLAPADTAAFPPAALSARVNYAPHLNMFGAFGFYPQESGGPYKRGEVYIAPNHPDSPYHTLLHEAAHVRQDVATRGGLDAFARRANPEADADRLMDSLFTVARASRQNLPLREKFFDWLKDVLED